ncbi:MAG TPA: VWA domain-containing protein [Verrucomicrobiae bacterium]|nr:VWA domain-containing protein [Verrucomicrobiae bacterium]
MPLKVDLSKMEESKNKLSLSLKKRGGTLRVPSAEVGFVIDVSGSYDDEHRDGLTNDLLVRLTPWAMVFDPDQQADVFTFSNGAAHAHHVGMVTPATVEGYVAKNIIGKVPGYGYGTDYSYVTRLTLQHFGWVAAGSAPQKSGGLLGGMFNRGGSAPAATAAPTGAGRKTLILFNTDGASSDEGQMEALLQEMQDKNYGVYIMFIGVSNQGGGFPFLKRMADKFDNCGLTVIRDVKAWVQKTDEEINDELITDELVKWMMA